MSGPDDDIAAGRVESFGSIEEMVASLRGGGFAAEDREQGLSERTVERPETTRVRAGSSSPPVAAS